MLMFSPPSSSSRSLVAEVGVESLRLWLLHRSGPSRISSTEVRGGRIEVPTSTLWLAPFLMLVVIRNPALEHLLVLATPHGTYQWL